MPGGSGGSESPRPSGTEDPTSRARPTCQTRPTGQASAAPWDRDEWDVSLSDGAVYRVFRDRTADAWFIDGIFD
jgi:hypothetical protein